jgi:diguanylate cyclase (GGDEF)-like protein
MYEHAPPPHHLHGPRLSLNEIGTATDNVEHLLDCIVAETMKFTDAAGAVVEQVEGDDLIYVRAAGQVAAFVGLRLPQQNSLSGVCVHSREIQRCDDTETDDRVNRAACRRIGIRSMLVVPLFFGGAVIGVIKACSERTAAFNSEHVQALKLAAGIIAAVLGRQSRLERSRREGAQLLNKLESDAAERDYLRHAVYVDDLTGLPNRRAFERAVTQALITDCDARKTMALLFMDANRFKAINDLFGHRVGDMALRRIADVLHAAVAAPHMVARLAGDEFVVLLKDLDQPAQQIADLCAHVSATLNEPQTLGSDVALPLPLSIGVALHEQDQPLSEWLHRADEAMYRVKKSNCADTAHTSSADPQEQQTLH